jgi:hypothetical protein
MVCQEEPGQQGTDQQTQEREEEVERHFGPFRGADIDLVA